MFGLLGFDSVSYYEMAEMPSKYLFLYAITFCSFEAHLNNDNETFQLSPFVHTPDLSRFQNVYVIKRYELSSKYSRIRRDIS